MSDYTSGYVKGFSVGVLGITLTAAAVGLAAGEARAENSLMAGNYGPLATHEEMRSDLVDTAVSSGQFGTLVAAIQAAGLADTLKGSGPFTVFAPTDAAFARIPEATLAGLLADKAALARVLTYHVVPGKVMAADVAGLSAARTVQGQSVTIGTSGGVTVDGANVTATDIVASNGVIHVIDRVIMPN